MDHGGSISRQGNGSREQDAFHCRFAEFGDEEEAYRQFSDTPIQTKLAKQSEALEGQSSALLWIVSTTDGAKLAEYQLECPPVWDGMVAANGRLYVATMDGNILCFADRK